jgi:hypothetical protein
MVEITVSTSWTRVNGQWHRRQTTTITDGARHWETTKFRIKSWPWRWSGEIPAHWWMNFYAKVLSRFATAENLSNPAVLRSTLAETGHRDMA